MQNNKDIINEIMNDIINDIVSKKLGYWYDKSFMCINCVKDYICSQPPSGKFDCPLGCTNLSSTIKNTIKKSDVENIIIEIKNKASGKISNILLCEYPEPDEDQDNDKDDSKEYDIRVF